MQERENRLTEGETVQQEFGGSGINVTPINSPTRSRSRSKIGAGNAAQEFAPTSEESLTGETVREYLVGIANDTTVSLGAIRDALLQRLNAAIAIENMGRKSAESTSPALTKIRVLDEKTVADVLLARHRLVAVDLSEGASDDMTLLALYVESGDDEGIYTTSETSIKALASELKPSMTAP